MRLVSLTVEVLVPEPAALDASDEAADMVEVAVAALAESEGWLPNVHPAAPPTMRRWVTAVTAEHVD